MTVNYFSYNGLLVNATMSQAVAGPSSSCDHIFDMEDQNTDSESHVSEKQDQPVFTAYKFAPVCLFVVYVVYKIL